MEEKSKCCAGGDVRVVLACSGGSNVGQITNEVAKALDEAGSAKFFCLAGVGAHLSGMVASVRGSDKVLVLDGCSVSCAKKCVDQAGIQSYEYLVMTDLGIEKNHTFRLGADDIDRGLIAATAKLGVSAGETSEVKRG